MPQALIYYREVPLIIVTFILFVLSIAVFPAQEIPYRLCMIGAFVGMIGCTLSPLWLVVNVGFICWNFGHLALVLWK